MHIVAPESWREKVFEEIRGPAFSLLEGRPLGERCTFLPYGSIKKVAAREHLNTPSTPRRRTVGRLRPGSRPPLVIASVHGPFLVLLKRVPPKNHTKCVTSDYGDNQAWDRKIGWIRDNHVQGGVDTKGHNCKADGMRGSGS